MSDLNEQLHRMVERVEPVTIEETTAVAQRHRRRRRTVLPLGTAVTVLAVVLVAVILMSGPGSRDHVRVVPSGKTTGSVTSTVTRAGITVRMRVNSTHAVAGHTIHGQIMVIDHTGHRLTAGEVCPGQAFAVALANRQFPPNISFSSVACDHGFSFPTGSSRWPFTMATTVGILPLPAGRYTAQLILDGFHIPTPTPIIVTLAASPGRSASPPTTPTIPPKSHHPPATVPPSTSPATVTST
jgi:hypothetical protein